ncbi:putative phosphodiesterase [Sagittula marina]|uniref:Putative phosphodiesterase n=1 Tax=Sagittula marina TaxID=943940 RepID=A0A7W6DTN1_9RHOB|nr:metallophosphoesterase family protein [Sagittula marina]MBB3985019.1 putative phosphodiesterase [Sagittula marina]
MRFRRHVVEPYETGPILAFGGPVSNLQATRALRAEAVRLGIPAARVICTGDVVAYCGDPVATVAEIRDWGCHVVAGNCERQLAEDAEGCGCGFDEGSTCDRLSAAWYAHARGAMDAETRAWMAGLPDEVSLGNIAAIHGGWTDISRFLWPTSAETDFIEELAKRAELTQAPQPQIVLAGHCGLPFCRQIENTLWVNAGSVGMPPNDGSPRTCYAIIDGDRVTQHRLDYDWPGAQSAMQAANLTQGYDRCLETGQWPSLEILPAALRPSG